MKTQISISIIAATVLFSPLFVSAQSATAAQALCMQNALDKRETAIIAALDVHNNSSKTAITNRQTGLKAAWNSLDRKTRASKRLTTYTAFRNEMTAAHIALRTAKTNAWNTFEDDTLKCGFKGSGESPEKIQSQNTSL